MRPVDVVRRLLALAPAALASRAVTPTRCVLATRVGLDVLTYFGVEARPRAVGVQVANAAMVRWVESGRTTDVVAEGGWRIEIVPGPVVTIGGRRYWNGHLVLDVPALRCLLDLDFQQFARPDKALTVPPAAAFYYADRPLTRCTWRLPSNGRVTYWSSGDDRWRQAPDWRRVPRELVGSLIRAIRQDASAAASDAGILAAHEGGGR